MAASADVTVYGQLHYSVDSIDYEDNRSGSIPGTGMDNLATAGYDGLGVNSHNSRFGIKGSEDLGNGLSAVFQMEFTIAGEDGALLGDSTVRNNRNTFVALAGSWGVAGIGQVDTPFKSSTGSLEMFSEQVGDYNALGFDDIRTDDAVFYMSPNMNGFQVVAGMVMPSATEDADGVEAISISGVYQNGPWFASLAYETISDNVINALYGADEDYDKWRLGLGYTANALHVGFIYEDRDIDNVADGDSWQLSASYTAGNNVFKIAYGQADDMTHVIGTGVVMVDDADLWSIGVDHKLSNRTTVYAAYADYSEDTDDMDWDALSLGIIHKF
jgi:predicted porin